MSTGEGTTGTMAVWALRSKLTRLSPWVRDGASMITTSVLRGTRNGPAAASTAPILAALAGRARSQSMLEPCGSKSANTTLAPSAA